MVHDHVHKNPPLRSVLSQLNAVNVVAHYISISLLVFFLYLLLRLPNGLFEEICPTEIYHAFLISLLYATCPAHTMNLC
jgi:hypothetical protein